MRYYKAVRRLDDGSLVSQFIETGTECLFRCVRLTYAPGQVTVAPPESMGIFCYSSLKQAYDYTGNTTPNWTGTVEIYEAHPIGKLLGGNDFPRFTSIKLGKRCVGKYSVRKSVERSAFFP
jgi:hypothetical protein